MRWKIPSTWGTINHTCFLLWWLWLIWLCIKYLYFVSVHVLNFLLNLLRSSAMCDGKIPSTWGTNHTFSSSLVVMHKIFILSFCAFTFEFTVGYFSFQCNVRWKNALNMRYNYVTLPRWWLCIRYYYFLSVYLLNLLKLQHFFSSAMCYGIIPSTWGINHTCLLCWLFCLFLRYFYSVSVHLLNFLLNLR